MYNIVSCDVTILLTLDNLLDLDNHKQKKIKANVRKTTYRYVHVEMWKKYYIKNVYYISIYIHTFRVINIFWKHVNKLLIDNLS